jgi:hypothetical protein
MPGPLAIVQHTPLWVFGLLAVLVVVGVQALRPRDVPVWRPLLVPVVFILWGVNSLLAKVAAAPWLSVDWLTATVIGFAIAAATVRLDGVQVDRAAGRVHLPGSPAPLARSLAIFVARYGLGATMVVAPALQSSLTPWDIAVSGLSAGYFIGWVARFATKYRTGRPPQPASTIA